MSSKSGVFWKVGVQSYSTKIYSGISTLLLTIVHQIIACCAIITGTYCVAILFYSFLADAFHFTPDECVMPTVQDFTAEYNSTNNAIMLRWDAISTGIICDRSKRFMVSVSLFDSYEDYLSKSHAFFAPYMNTSMRRDKHFTIPLSDIYTLNRYYVFQVRNQHIAGNISASVPFEILRTQIHTSNIYFFGNQGEAMCFVMLVYLCCTSLCYPFSRPITLLPNKNLIPTNLTLPKKGEITCDALKLFSHGGGKR